MFCVDMSDSDTKYRGAQLLLRLTMTLQICCIAFQSGFAIILPSQQQMSAHFAQPLFQHLV